MYEEADSYIGNVAHVMSPVNLAGIILTIKDAMMSVTVNVLTRLIENLTL